MNNPKVSVIILNWNGWKDTIECLESLYQITYPNYNVIVVDNGSGDDSIEKIKEWAKGKINVESKFFKYNSSNKPIKIIEYTKDEIEVGSEKEKEIANIPLDRKLIIIKNDKNYGFAEGNNIGIKYSLKSLDPEYVLLLNNDIVVDKEFLGELVKVAESDEKIGIVGPKICRYNFNGRNDIISYIGPKINWMKYPGYGNSGELLVDLPGKFTGAMECGCIGGTAMMIKIKEVPIKFLNTEFFFGCEDIDLCIRLKKHGYKMVQVLDSKIWHKGGISRKKRYKSKIKRQLIDIKTNFKFIKTHNDKYYLFLPLYIAQILTNSSIAIFKKLYKRYL